MHRLATWQPTNDQRRHDTAYLNKRLFYYSKVKRLKIDYVRVRYYVLEPWSLVTWIKFVTGVMGDRKCPARSDLLLPVYTAVARGDTIWPRWRAWRSTCDNAEYWTDQAAQWRYTPRQQTGETYNRKPYTVRLLSLVNVGALRDGVVILFVCSFVCLLWNLLSHSPGCSTGWTTGAYRIVSETLATNSFLW